MKQKIEKRFIFIPIGLIIISATLIMAHYTSLSDSVRGVLTGIGIGLMIVPVAFKKHKMTTIKS